MLRTAIRHAYKDIVPVKHLIVRNDETLFKTCDIIENQRMGGKINVIGTKNSFRGFRYNIPFRKS